MSCDRMRIEILALLDDSLGGLDASRIRRHFQTCPSCSRFHEEQRELNALLKSALELDPPVRIWQGIESRLMSCPAMTPPSNWFAALFHWPGFRYAFASAVLLALVSLAVFKATLSPRPHDDQILAEIRAYQVHVQGNSFVRRMERENPFHAFGLPSGKNPFNSTRSMK